MKNGKRILSVLMAAGLALTCALPATAAVPADNATSSGITVTDVDNDGVIRVACVGDSITAGTNDTNYPMYLQEFLTYLGSQNGKTYQVRNHGKGGAACRHVKENYDINGDGVYDDYFYYDDYAYTSSLTYTPDVVIVQMGTNDALGGNWDNWDNYFNSDYYNYLVKPYADKGALVVLSTPPYACNGWHNDNVNGPVHDREVALANSLGLPIVDTNRLLYGMDEVFADGLHGNFTGYYMMAMNFYKYVFGGTPITATFYSNPYAKIILRDTATGREFTRLTDGNGEAVMDFLNGRSYNFSVRIEATGCMPMTDTISLSASRSFTFDLPVGGSNIAPSGTTEDCGVAVYESTHTADNINDGDKSAPGYQPDTYQAGDWCGLTFSSSHDINMLVLYWETASYISPYADGGYDVSFRINGQWVQQNRNNIDSSRAPYEGDIVVDTLMIDPSISADGVRITYRDGQIGDHKFAPHLFELEVYENVATPNVTASLSTSTAAVGGTVTVTVSNDAMSVCSLSAGISFDRTRATCTGITVSGLNTSTGHVNLNCVSSVTEANNAGVIGFALVSGTEATYNAGTILTATFTLNTTGTTNFTVFETSDGTNGFSPAQATDTSVVSVAVSGSIQPVLLGDVDLDGYVSAADLTVLARHVAGIAAITDAQAIANGNVDGNAGLAAADLTMLARRVAHIGTL